MEESYLLVFLIDQFFQVSNRQEAQLIPIRKLCDDIYSLGALLGQNVAHPCKVFNAGAALS